LGITFDVIEYPDYGAEGWVFTLLQRKHLVCNLHAPIFVPKPYDTQPPQDRDTRWAEALEHFAMRRAKVMTAPSRHLVDILKEHSWLHNCPVKLIPYAIELHTWTNVRPVHHSAPVVLFIGRLEQNKAPEMLVEAMPLIRQEIPEATAIFIGRSSGRREGMPYMDWLKMSATDLRGCQFTGQLHREEILQYISTSRVVAVPSWSENYSFVAVEGMAAGRPVVLTSTNGVAELVQQTQSGAIIPPGDPKALAAAALPYLRDVMYAARTGDRARAAVQARHHPDIVAAQREQVYQQISHQ
jgi:glycosyltransferase involved in cell wall biosynthesis